MKKSELKQMIKEQMIAESNQMQIEMSIGPKIEEFLKTVVLPASKGYVRNERDAAILLYDILKNKYKFAQSS